MSIRYEVRYVSPEDKWEPANPKFVRRLLAEMQYPQEAIEWMARGNELRTNFADYRIHAANLDADALKRREQIDAHHAARLADMPISRPDDAP